MDVICLDGTTIQCDRFRATDEGILLFSATEEEEDPAPTGFIPHQSLRYVLEEQPQQRSPETGQWVSGDQPQPHQAQKQPPAASPPPGQANIDPANQPGQQGYPR